MLKATPDADWAFRPLVVAFTMTERWREVLDAYDARLAVGGGIDRRADMLEEAARIAKDFIGDHARAVGYLDQLFRLRPGDGQVASSLERLLERHERWAELVAARRFRLEMLAGPRGPGAAASRRDHAARKARPARRGARRGARAAPRPARGRPARGIARTAAGGRTRRVRDTPRRARRPAPALRGDRRGRARAGAPAHGDPVRGGPAPLRPASRVR